jgi:hypothetical protein
MQRTGIWLVIMLLLAAGLPALSGGATTSLLLEGEVLTGDGASVVRGATVSLLVYNTTDDLVHQDLTVTGLGGNYSFTIPANRWDPGWNITLRASYALVGEEGRADNALTAATSQEVDVRIPWNRTLGAKVTVERPHVTTPRDGIASFVVNVTNGGNDTDPVLLWMTSSNASIQSIFHPSNRTELSPDETNLLSLVLSNPGLLPGDYDVKLGWRSEWYSGEEGTVDLTWTVLPDVDLVLPPTMVSTSPDPLLEGDDASLSCTVLNAGRDTAEKANITVEVIHPTQGQVLRDRVRLDVPGANSTVATFPWKAVFSEEPYSLIFEVEHPLDTSQGNDRVQLPMPVGVSNTPPAVTFISPANGTSVNKTVTVVMEVVDPDTPVVSLQLRIGGGPWIDIPPSDPEYTWDTTTIEDDWYILEAYATDRYVDGPVSEHSLKVENMGPNHPPEVFVESPMEGDTVGDLLKTSGIAFDQDDNVQEVRLRIDNGTWEVADGTTRWSANISTTGLDEGAHVLQVIADDGIDTSEIARVQFAVTTQVANTLTMTLEVFPATVLPGERVNVEGELLYDNGIRAEGLNVRIEGPNGLLVFKEADTRGVFKLSTVAPASEGTYLYTASTTDGGGLAASNTTTLRVLRSLDPDLAVEAIVIESNRVAVGSNVTVAVRIENLGYTPGNGTLRAWEGAPGTGELLEERNLTVHTSVTISFVWVPEEKDVVDLTVEVVDVLPSDANASNNQLVEQVEVVDLPDLKVGMVTLSNPRPYDNTTISASVRIDNVGGLNASCTVKLYMGVVEPENLIGDSEAAVGANSFTYLNFEFLVTVGPQSLVVEIVNSYPEESDVTNNMGAHTFTVNGPYKPPTTEPDSPILGPIDPFIFLLILVGATVATIGGILFLRHN